MCENEHAFHALRIIASQNSFGLIYMCYNMNVDFNNKTSLIEIRYNNNFRLSY